jgi:hypothetical protein
VKALWSQKPYSAAISTMGAPLRLNSPAAAWRRVSHADFGEKLAMQLACGEARRRGQCLHGPQTFWIAAHELDRPSGTMVRRVADRPLAAPPCDPGDAKDLRSVCHRVFGRGKPLEDAGPVEENLGLRHDRLPGSHDEPVSLDELPGDVGRVAVVIRGPRDR